MYTVLAVLGGYTCGKLMKMFEHHQQCHYVTFLCGAALPGAGLVCYTYVSVLNPKLASLYCLLFGVSIPLTFLGSSIAYRQPAIQPVTKVGRVVREIPVQPYDSSAPFIIIFQLLPVSFLLVVCGNPIFEAMWRGRVYNTFGYLSLMFILWVCVTVTVTILVIYNRLVNGNHRWWWSSFLAPGCATGVYFFVFEVYYYLLFVNNANISTIGMLKYFLVGVFLSIVCGLVSGTIGLLSSLIFTRRIYSLTRIVDTSNIEGCVDVGVVEVDDNFALGDDVDDTAECGHTTTAPTTSVGPTCCASLCCSPSVEVVQGITIETK